ncbi:hypothetical protein E0K89_005840 [Aquicoccus sp. SCR17]|nr:hypothetical protein [Carideicomes alvinocaridis]
MNTPVERDPRAAGDASGERPKNPAETKADRTDRAAREILSAEKTARDEATARLRAARLQRDKG